ncbi:MAG: ABC transporter ATP-binding protein [Methanomicrobiales archaeon]
MTGHLTIRNVWFGYIPDQPVLRGLSIDAAQGELLGILGPNGSGKTTLLRVMAGYLHPRDGDVSLGGRPLQQMDAREISRKRAVVEQRLSAPFAFPVYDYVLLGRTPYLSRFRSAGAADHHAVVEALDRTHTLHLQDRDVSELSGGELQRVMIARALAQEPRFLLLDEPTSHLDIRHQLEVMNLLADLSRDIAVVTIVHDINLAARYCHRIALLGEGRVQVDGAPSTVLTPASLEETFEVTALKRSIPENRGHQFTFSLPPQNQHGHGRRVQIICGGGTGMHVLLSLDAAGYEVGVGVLNEGDEDLSIARSLGCETITSPPFSEIGSGARTALARACEHADALVVVAMPVGPGNLANLEVVSEHAGEKPVILLDGESEQGFDRFDYTGGHASRLYREIAQGGEVAATAGELHQRLERIVHESEKITE